MDQPLYQSLYQPSQPPIPPIPPTSTSGTKRTKKDRACDLCRRKKIRCDYDSAYPQNSCTSCRSYSKQCTFKEAAKKRGPPKGYVEGLESRLKRMEKLLMNIANNGTLPTEAAAAAATAVAGLGKSAEQQQQQLNADSSDSITGNNSNASGSDTKDEEEEEQPNEQQLTTYTTDNCNTSTKDEPFSYVGSSSGIYLLSRLFPKDNSSILPDATEVLPRPLEGHEDDLMIARFNGDRLNKFGFGRKYDPEWKLPPKELTDYLVSMYFDRFNTILPILDEEQFYESYRQKTYSSTFIAIIMTVCRVTCRLLKKDDAIVKKYKVDRASLFHDIEKQLDLNFDLDFLEPKIETIQVLLLNAANASKWGLESTDWITTSIAVKMAQDLGLHRANTQHEAIPKKDTESRKRLWWSAYVIDRVVCASLGRPLTISDADCDVDYPNPQDTKYAQFIHLVKLACILGDILRALCSPRARMMSEKGLGLENISRNLELMLLDWKNALPDHLNLTDSELSQISRNEIDFALEMKLNAGAGKLRLAYCGVYLLSKRPFISMKTVNASDVKMPDECQQTLKIAVDLFDNIEPSNLLCFWSLSTYCLGQTQMLLFLNYKNIDANLIAESKTLSERFQKRHQCLEDYITEKSLLPFLATLSKVIMGDQDKPSQNKNDEAIMDQQSSLWGASSGIEWQEMVKLLSETGYNI